MLRTRVLTGLLMAVAGLALLFLASQPLFVGLVAVLLLGLGGREGGRLAGLPSEFQPILFAALLLAPAAALYWFGSATLTRWLLLLAVLLWVLLFLWLARPQFGRNQRGLKLLVLGCILLAAWLAAVSLHQESAWLILVVVVVVAAADIGAYFTGRAIGGPKLAPAISPGKTLSGAAGGLLAAALAAGAAALLLPQAAFAPLMAILIGVLLALASIGGDLFISLLKRQQGLKDTSSLLPGHGGILDRFDGLSAALPVFALIWLWWGR